VRLNKDYNIHTIVHSR